MFKGNVTAIPMTVASNAGEDFSNMRKHGADGSIAQAYGGSSISDWVGDSIYSTERMTAGRANGTFASEPISKSKQAVFDTGHDYEQSIAIHNCRLMSIRSGIEVIAHDASKEEWRNDAWPSMAAHLDFFIQVVKGRIIPNPKFIVGGAEKNYVIVPDANDHWYIGDSKSVQSRFGANWAETDENGIPCGGMKYGICPTHYRQQMLSYMATCHMEGALIMGACGFAENDHAQVFVPYDAAEAESLMDEVEAKNTASLHGYIPSVRECKDVAMAISELPLQYPDVNASKKKLKLDTTKWKVSFDRILEIDSKVAEVSEKLKPIITEFKNKVYDELGEKVAGSVSVDTESTKKLKDERKQIIMLPLEEVKDGPGCFFIDDNGDVVTIDYSSGIKWDTKAKTAIADDYPEIFDDLKHRFPDRKPSYSRNAADKSKKSGKTV